MKAATIVSVFTLKTLTLILMQTLNKVDLITDGCCIVHNIFSSECGQFKSASSFTST